jgi:hypothetical protein
MDSTTCGDRTMKRVIFIWVMVGWLATSLIASMKDISIPSSMVLSMSFSNEQGFLHGDYDGRIRLFNRETKALLWNEDFEKLNIVNGSAVLIINEVPLIDPEYFHYSDLVFAITLDGHTVELPLMTEIYAFRSKFSEFAWDTRFHDTLYIDREKEFVAIGFDALSTPNPTTHLHVQGPIKLSDEDTTVVGAIRYHNKKPEVLNEENRWVDLTYTDTEFNTSQWTRNENENENAMSLSDSTANVGIHVADPKERLVVSGNVYVSDTFDVASMVVAEQLQSSHFLFRDGVFKNQPGASLQLLFDDNLSIWDASKLSVDCSNVSGCISGDGSQLTDIGSDTAFTGALIQSHHLLPSSVKTNHLTDYVLSSRNIVDGTIAMSKLKPSIFLAAHIPLEVFEQSNLIDDLFSVSQHFNSELQNQISRTVPEGYFTVDSEYIATHAITNNHIQNFSLFSHHLNNDVFGSSAFDDDSIIGSYVSLNAIVQGHFKPNSVSFDSINGVLKIEHGGTGRSSVSPNRLVVYDDSDRFSFLDNILVSDTGRLYIANKRIFDTSNMQDWPLLKLEYVDVPATLVIEKDQGDFLSFKSQSVSVNLGVHKHGSGTEEGFYITGSGGAPGYFSKSGLSFGNETFSSSHEHLYLGGAITIATANSNAAGTIEYKRADDEFIFHIDGGSFVAGVGVGIGSPLNIASSLDLNDTYLGQSEYSHIQATASMITDVDDAHVQVQESSLRGIVSSTIRGNGMNLDHIMGVTVDGDSIIGGQVSRSHVRADVAHIRQVSDSFLQGARFTGQQIQRSTVVAQDAELVQVNGATIDAANAVVRGVRDVTVEVMDSTVVGVSDTDITGQGLDVRQVQDSVIEADRSRVAQVQGATIIGSDHMILNADMAMVQGKGNVVMASDGANVLGDDNRVFGDDQWIRGDANTVFGEDVYVEGNNNIVFHAGDNPLQVVGDDQIVLSAPRGIYIATAPDMVVSATEAGGGWSMVSDRTLKTNFVSVDYKNVFNQLMALPITEWEYTFNKGVRHIGPMAQDFKQAFGLGSDERFITATDADGVAYAAIKHLILELDRLPQVEYHNVSDRLEALQRILDGTQSILNTVEASLVLKQKALDVIADRNFDQYKLLDKQFKGLAKLPRAPTWWWLGWRIGVIFGIFFIGTALGFWGIKRYYNRG